MGRRMEKGNTRGDPATAEAIRAAIGRNPDDIEPYKDLYYFAAAIESKTYMRWLSDEIEKRIATSKAISELYVLHRKTLLWLAPHFFESYLLFTEWDRPPEKKFYPPRRKRLKKVVRAMQMLEDGDLDLLAVSLPPGVGKTTLAIFYLTWLAGRHPLEPILTGSHSNAFIRGVYDEVLRILNPHGEYLWSEVFPSLAISFTNAKDCRIDIGERQRFETLEFTTIGSGNAGLYRAERLLYCDDLVSGIEVAMSMDRLDKLWETYTTDLRQRKMGSKCKELHIATRWSLYDVVGRLEKEYKGSDRAKFIAEPAVDDKGNSRFNYAYGVGFSTDFYKEQQSIMDKGSWNALYMSEPIETQGILFPEDELRYFFDVPDEEPDVVMAACDTKDTGKDYCCMPIAYKYGDDYFIEDILCTNAKPEIVQERICEMLIKHNVTLCRFESNSAGGQIAKQVQEEMLKRGHRISISTKFTSKNKETKILVASAFIKKHFLFKCMPTGEYKDALRMLCSYSMTNRNAHDDVPDGLAQLWEYCQSLRAGKVEIFRRPW